MRIEQLTISEQDECRKPANCICLGVARIARLAPWTSHCFKVGVTWPGNLGGVVPIYQPTSASIIAHARVRRVMVGEERCQGQHRRRGRRNAEGAAWGPIKPGGLPKWRSSRMAARMPRTKRGYPVERERVGEGAGGQAVKARDQPGSALLFQAKWRWRNAWGPANEAPRPPSRSKHEAQAIWCQPITGPGVRLLPDKAQGWDPCCFTAVGVEST